MKPYLFLLLFFSTQVIAEKAAVKLNDNDWPPFFFGGEYNDISSKGIGKEVLDRCLPSTGYEHEYTFYPIARMRKYMEEGKLDINIYSYRPSRESFLVYGKESIFSAGYRPVVRKNQNITINSIADFDKYQLGHLLGLRYSPEFYEYVMLRHEQERLITTTRSSYVLKMLMSEQIDVFVGISQSALWYAKEAGVTHQIEVLDFDIKTSDYFVTLSKRSNRVKDKALFLSQVDQCIRTIKDNGEYKRILDRYRFWYELSTLISLSINVSDKLAMRHGCL